MVKADCGDSGIQRQAIGRQTSSTRNLRRSDLASLRTYKYNSILLKELTTMCKGNGKSSTKGQFALLEICYSLEMLSIHAYRHDLEEQSIQVHSQQHTGDYVTEGLADLYQRCYYILVTALTRN